MAYEKRQNTGTLGKNKRKEQDNHPDYAGQINVDGRDYWLSGWVKENKETGERFFSLSVKPKEQRAEKPKPAPVVSGEPDDDIPFAWTFAVPVAGLIAGAMYAQDVLQMWA